MSEPQTVTILQLYPKDMNIYGDWGNTLTLKRRLEWHGYHVELLEYNPGDVLPEDIDLVVGGVRRLGIATVGGSLARAWQCRGAHAQHRRRYSTATGSGG